MGHPLRQYLPSMMYEVTIRVMQGRYLLRPDRQTRAIVLTVIARALRLFQAVRLHAFDCQSNHLHQLLSSTDGESIAAYLCYVHGNIARRVGRLRGWTGPFWGRRGRVIPVLDDAAAIGRLRYVIAQGVAAGLVSSPRDWPGASSTPALLGEMSIRVETAEAQEEVVVLTPIAAWAGLTPELLRARHAAIVSDIEREHVGRRVAGVAQLVVQDPFHAPPVFESTRAPDCHGSTQEICERFRIAYRRFREAFWAAAARVRQWLSRLPSGESVDASAGEALRRRAGFPEGSWPRPRWYERPRGVVWPPWEDVSVVAA